MPSFLSECILRYLLLSVDSERGKKKEGIGDILFEDRYTTYIPYQCNRVFSHSELWVLGRMSKGKKVKEGEVEGETKKGQMVASSSQPSGSGHAPIESERTSAAMFPGVQENHRLAGNRPSPNNQSVSFFFPMLFFTYHLPQPRATSPSTSFSFPSFSQA